MGGFYRVGLFFFIFAFSLKIQSQNDSRIVNELKKAGCRDSVSLVSDFFQVLGKNDSLNLFKLIPNELLIYTIGPSCKDESMRAICDSLNKNNKSGVYLSLVYDPFIAFQQELKSKQIVLSSLKNEKVQFTKLDDSISKLLPIQLYYVEYLLVDPKNKSKYNMTIGSVCSLFSRWFVLEIRLSLIKIND